MDLMIKQCLYPNTFKEALWQSAYPNYPAIVVPKALAIGIKLKATFTKAYKKECLLALEQMLRYFLMVIMPRVYL
jgi:hypothetical protein